MVCRARFMSWTISYESKLISQFKYLLIRSPSFSSLCALVSQLSCQTSNFPSTYRKNGRLSDPDLTHLVYTLMRIGSSSGRRSTRSRLSHQKLVNSSLLCLSFVSLTRYPSQALIGPMVSVGKAYDSFNRKLKSISHPADLLTDVTSEKRSEVAHALYLTQLCFGEGGKVSTVQVSLSTLVVEEATALESGLSLFLGIWARFFADSTDIYRWLINPSKNVGLS